MDDTQSIDSESKATNDRRLEEIIIGIILKIKKSRSRPCYQNILTFDLYIEAETPCRWKM